MLAPRDTAFTTQWRSLATLGDIAAEWRALAQRAVEPKVGSPADFAVFLARETEKWGAVVKAANIRID